LLEKTPKISVYLREIGASVPKKLTLSTLSAQVRAAGELYSAQKREITLEVKGRILNASSTQKMRSSTGNSSTSSALLPFAHAFI
jgi:hypothetical protein